ncbi:MAG: cold shock domain-containing protein [Deltaproteobacteria bacterium]|nr:cold shock domain-containing protein [Deltaproteobacteria bacterium]
MNFESTSSLRVRLPNWLPVPVGRGREEIVEPSVDDRDLFTKGKVARYYPHQGFGFVKNEKGEDIYFKIAELDLVGPKADKKYLREGARVGFDVAWTSKGLHIRYLKIY